jgi:hypothetical protein
MLEKVRKEANGNACWEPYQLFPWEDDDEDLSSKKRKRNRDNDLDLDSLDGLDDLDDIYSQKIKT